jgi:hypothetical protein
MRACAHTHAHAAGPIDARLTSARGSDVSSNHLTGTLPAALGALTDLSALCARPLGARREGPARPAPPNQRSRTRAVLRSGLESNVLTGTIGSWISSLAKLKILYARLLPPQGGTPGAAHAHQCSRHFGVVQYSARGVAARPVRVIVPYGPIGRVPLWVVPRIL